MGDWIGVRGTMMRTKRGQLSVAVASFELLSKSLRPLPEKFHGLADKETRYRQRYVDLVMNPEVKQVFEKRFKIVAAIRRYMEEQGFYEVETPFLHPILGGANAKPFVTHFNALDRDYYLRIATELPLKRLLVGGFEKVFEIGRQFRNEGMDPYHNPEFTTMEAYQAFSDLEGMMELTQGYIQAAAMAACGTLRITYQGQEVDLSGEWPRKSMIELASAGAGEDVSFARTRDELAAILEKNGGHADSAWGKGKLIAEIFEAVAEEKLIQPTFVIDHPLEVSPLAKKKAGDPNLTERFELFICGHEYANAFGELNDPVDQAERFRAQVEAKDMGDDEAMGYDEDYVRALEYGMPPAGGVGVGIDRLVMLLADAPSIRDVLLFPHMRDEALTGGRGACCGGGRRRRRFRRCRRACRFRLLEGGHRAFVRRAGGLRDVQQVGLPCGQGERMRRGAQEQEAAQVHARRRHRCGPRHPLRHSRLLRAGGLGGQDARRHHEPAAAQDDGHRLVRHDHQRRPRGGGRGAPEPAHGG